MAATELATAYLSLVPSMRGAQGKIAQELGAVDADGIGKGIGGKMGGGIAGSLKGLVGPALAGLAAIGFGGYIAEAARASDATDKFKGTLNFAGLDTGAIEAATAAARGYADETVYELSDIQATMAQLAANGVADYTGITQAAGNLNAVAGGNAETFKSVSRAVTQSAGAGKLMTEDWNMLADAIPGASGQLQAAMREAGAFEGNFRKAMENGEISADEFQAAISKLGSDPIAVEAARSVTTFEGALGNLEATVNSGLMGALDALKPAITGAINGVASGLQVSFDWIGNMFSGLQSFLAGVDFTGALSGMAGAGTMVRDSFAGVWDAISPLIPDLVALWQAASPVSTIFAAIGPSIGPLLGILGQLVGVVGTSLASAITGVLPAIQVLQGVLISVFMDTLAAVLPVVVQLVGMLGSTLASIIPILVPIIVQVASLAAALISQLAPIFMQLVSAVLPMVVSALGAILGAIGPVIQIVAGLLIPAIQALMPVVVTVFGVVVSLITSAMQIVQGIIQVVTGMISGNWSQVFTGLGNIAAGAFGFIVNLISGAISVIGSVIGAGLQFVGQVFINVWNGVTSFLGGVWGNITSGVSGMIGEVTGFFSGLIGKITGAIGDAGGALLQTGKDIIQGLINGIGSMMGAIGRAVIDIVPEAIRGPFESLLGIASPSKVFRAYGVNIGEGLVLGIQDMYDPVAEATALLAVTPEPPAFASSAALNAYADYAATGADTGRSGPLVEQIVYPAEKMSEENLAEIAARKIVGALT